MLEESIRKYQNRSLQAAQVIQELIDLAKDMRHAHERGEKLGLSDEELGFYDALDIRSAAPRLRSAYVVGQKDLFNVEHHFVRIDTRGSAAYAPGNHVAEHSDYLSTAEGGQVPERPEGNRPACSGYTKSSKLCRMAPRRESP